MICPLCENGTLRRQNVPVEKFGVRVGVFQAEVCSSCGEPIFDSKTAGKIEFSIKKLGLWGVPVHSRIYKVGGNFMVSIKKSVAQALGITKLGKVRLIPQASQKRLVVELA